MMHEQLIVQVHQFPLSVNKTYSQILLFTIGIVFSLFFGYFMLPYIFTFEDLVWYMLGMVVPMLPSILSLEDW